MTFSASVLTTEAIQGAKKFTAGWGRLADTFRQLCCFFHKHHSIPRSGKFNVNKVAEPEVGDQSWFNEVHILCVQTSQSGPFLKMLKMRLQDWQKEFEEMKRQKKEEEKNLWKNPKCLVTIKYSSYRPQASSDVYCNWKVAKLAHNIDLLFSKSENT